MTTQKPKKAKKNKGGRPRKINQKMIDEVCKILRAGVYRSVACKIVGLDQSMFSQWYKRGSQEDSGIYYEFHKAVDMAENWAEYVCTMNLVQAAETDWKAAKAYLSCKFPSRWSATREDKQAEAVETIKIEIAGLPDGAKAKQNKQDENDDE